MNCEAQTMKNKVISRKCLLLRAADVSLDVLKKAIVNNVAGVVIIIPSFWSNNLVKVNFYILIN